MRAMPAGSRTRIAMVQEAAVEVVDKLQAKISDAF